jgi:hypothetical protein
VASTTNFTSPTVSAGVITDSNQKITSGVSLKKHKVKTIVKNKLSEAKIPQLVATSSRQESKVEHRTISQFIKSFFEKVKQSFLHW